MLTPDDIEQFRSAFQILDFQNIVKAENALKLLIEASEIHARYIRDKAVLTETQRAVVEQQIRNIKLRYKEAMFLCGEHADDEVIRGFDSILRKVVEPF